MPTNKSPDDKPKSPLNRESLPDDAEVTPRAEEDIEDRISAHPENDPSARWYKKAPPKQPLKQPTKK
jgi:hypothetical protein